MSNLPELDAILAQPNPADALAVGARLAAIEAALPPTDGIACFNHLYVTVTAAVNAAVAELADPAFIGALDVAFGALYFDALREYHQGALTREAWRPLFEARRSPDISPMQFALAGMNAHINRDLPLGLASVWRAAPPTEAQRRAFASVNALLAEVERAERERYFRGPLATRRFAHDEDAVAMWSVEAARAAAWANGEVLSTLAAHGHDTLARVWVATLDDSVGLASRALLLSLPSP